MTYFLPELIASLLSYDQKFLFLSLDWATCNFPSNLNLTHPQNVHKNYMAKHKYRKEMNSNDHGDLLAPMLKWINRQALGWAAKVNIHLLGLASGLDWIPCCEKRKWAKKALKEGKAHCGPGVFLFLLVPKKQTSLKKKN